MYALQLDSEKRIESYTTPPEAAIRIDAEVEDLPDVKENEWLSDYKYIDGKYVYDPVPRPPDPEPPEPSEVGDVTYDELAQAIREGVNSYGF